MSIYVLGAGGHARVILGLLRALNRPVAGLLDDHSAGQEVMGYPVLGPLDALPDRPDTEAVMAIGANRVRQALATRWTAVNWVTLVHPAAFVDPGAQIGPGSVVMAGAVVQPGAHLGRHVIVNTGATVDHDCRLQDFVHVAPGVHLAGQVTLEEGVFMGVASAALPGVQVGAWTVIGGGGVVTRTLPGGVVATGLPARPRGT